MSDPEVTDPEVTAPAGRLRGEPADVLCAVLRVERELPVAWRALGITETPIEELLDALDELVGSGAQYPLCARLDLPETIRCSPVGRVLLRGGDPNSTYRALLLSWFLGNGVVIEATTGEAGDWAEVAEAFAATGLALPELLISRAGAPLGRRPDVVVDLSREPRLMRWRDVTVPSWTRGLVRFETLPGVVAGHRPIGRGDRLPQRLQASVRLLVEMARREPFHADRLPAGHDGRLVALPVQSKEDLLAASESVEPAGGRRGANGQVLRSGATTGAPRYISYSRRDWANMVGEAVPMLYAAGLEPGDRVLNTLFGGNLYGGLTTSVCELSRMSVQNFTAGQHVTPAELVDLARRFGLDAIIGQPALILPLLRDAHRLDASLRVPKVLFGGTALAEHDRQWLRTRLGTRRVSSILAANDGAQIGYQCEHQHGRSHHLVDDFNYVEVARADGTPAAENEPGEILLTTLQKLHDPLIRYRIGDVGSLSWASCACGVTGRTLDYLGRADGIIKVKARTVTYAELLAALEPFAVSQLRAVIDTVGGTEVVRLEIETAEPVSAAVVRQHVADSFEALSDQHAFGGDRDIFRLEVVMHRSGELPREPVSGKVRQVVDKRLAAAGGVVR
jgi:phenylacetate-coenzyme A ligase PaaK-like adenylate-forming protein